LAVSALVYVYPLFALLLLNIQSTIQPPPLPPHIPGRTTYTTPHSLPAIPRLASHSIVFFTITGTPYTSLIHITSPRQMDVSKLLQLQTSIAHPQQNRPQAQPQQRVPSLTPSNSTDSTASMSRNGSYSGDSSSPSTPPRTHYLQSPVSACDDFVRCSRCHRSASLSSPGPLDGMISFGLNLYYCGRCASMTGYNKR
jgi:hypothetical protein